MMPEVRMRHSRKLSLFKPVAVLVVLMASIQWAGARNCGVAVLCCCFLLISVAYAICNVAYLHVSKLAWRNAECLPFVEQLIDHLPNGGVPQDVMNNLTKNGRSL